MAFTRLHTLLWIGILLSAGQASPSPARALVNRTQSTVPRGVVIQHCTVPGTVALTFDDGPHVYTSHILDLLGEHGAKATFFVNGDNWSHNIDDPSTPWPEVLRRMVHSGHQIGSHTWSHADLTLASSEVRRYQVRRLEEVLCNVLGKAPTYLRPPYASCSSDCVAEMEQLGYRVVNFDLDTKDYLHNQPGNIGEAMDNFSRALRSGDPGRDSFLVLSHDVLEQTAAALVPFMLEEIQRRGYRAVTVGECLGDPAEHWYRGV